MPAQRPWHDRADQSVFLTGAWILPDDHPLSPELEAFLDAGEPPVYFGSGSISAPADRSQVMDDPSGARALGRRAILLRGWADLSLVDKEADYIAIGEVNHQALFKQVATIVQQLGIGTTHPTPTLTADSLTSALEQTLRPDMAAAVRSDGTLVAAQRLINAA